MNPLPPSFAREVQRILHRVTSRREAAPAPRLSTLASRPSPGFTLIELLIVISIIAILAALAFPAVNGAIESSRKAQARNDVQQIATAIKAFKSLYGRFPTEDINTTDNDVSDHYYNSNRNIIRALLAEDTALNTKEQIFLEVRNAGRGRSGIDDNFEYLDPWGNSYIIKIDTNYNGKTEYYGDRFTSVIVFSPGPDGATGDPNANSGTGKDDIYSFK